MVKGTDGVEAWGEFWC